MAEPLVPGPSRFEVEIATAKLKKNKSSGSDKILAELIQAEGEILLSAIHKLINSVWNKEELPDQWKESIILQIHKKGDKTDCNNYRGIIIIINRSATDQLFCTRQILEKKWEYNETLLQLFVDFKKAYDSVRREVLYNILIELGVPMKLVRLIRMCLNACNCSQARKKTTRSRHTEDRGTKEHEYLKSAIFLINNL
jgi:hypothetical protein